MTDGQPDRSVNRPIIIVGCPRSGTTLLSAMLHSHPRIAMPPETRFLLSGYRRREKFGDLRDANNRERLAAWITRRQRGPNFFDLGISPAATVQRIVDGPPTLGSAFAAVWEEFAESRGKQRWGEKRPAYTLWTDVIQRLFPDVQFVHIVRDPRACVASLLATRWWKGGFPRAVTAWLRAEWALRRLERTAPPGVYYRLRYEDLVNSPRAELTRLCGYLGEEFAEEMLDHTRAADDIVRKRQHHHDRTHGAVDPTRIEAWRTSLSPEQIGLIELVTRRPMRRHGYERSGAGVRPPARLLLAFGKQLRKSVREQRRLARRDAARLRRETQPLAAVHQPRAVPRSTAGEEQALG